MSGYQKPYLGTKPAAFGDVSKTDIPRNFGVYKGIVKQIDTSYRSGKIFVYIPAFGTANENAPSGWQPVTYASPFYGETQGDKSIFSLSPPSQANAYKQTKQSYGFFVGPPDLGSTVLCCFPEGVRQEGYWFACITPHLSRYMTPANGSLPYSLIDKSTVPDQLKSKLKERDIYGNENRYPVGEFNENTITPFKDNWYDSLRPINEVQTYNLIRQGLDQDPFRGAISSSMQRDPVSAVYGISTPGRAFNPVDPAKDPDLANKINTGNFNVKSFDTLTRVGGHSLVMDDGDLYNNNNLVRLKTSAGHQILMNDSEGFIYISNSSGTAWVELTERGDILIYGQNDLSIRTQGSIMLKSDKNINLDAAGSVNIFSKSKIAMESTVIQTNAEGLLNLYGKQAQVKSSGTTSIIAGSSMILNANGRMALNAAGISLNGGGGSVGETAPLKLPKYSLPDTRYANGTYQVIGGALTSINNKIPTHEPYMRTSTTVVITKSTDINGNVINPTPVEPGDNVKQAKERALSKQAPQAYFTKQVRAASGIGALGVDEITAYNAQIGFRESGEFSNQYSAINQLGYVGKYQLGSLALQDLKYIKPNTPQSVEAISNPSNWTNVDGMGSLQDFLSNPQIQESAMQRYTSGNYKTLQNTGVINSATSKEDIAGYLAASHLIGAGDTTKWVKGDTSGRTEDKNHTRVEEFFNLGRYSISQTSVVISAQESRSKGSG